MSRPTSATGKSPVRKKKFTVDALFTDTRPQAAGVQDLTAAKEIALERIHPDPDQPRRHFNEARMEELVRSIAQEGVLQPIVVRYVETDDIYIVVHGERRYRASKQAGLAAIPAVVREVNSDRVLVHQLMENIQREDLNAIDRASALRSLKTQMADTSWEAVADVVGIKRSRLFQLLGTEKLPLSVQEDIRSGRLSEKQSRALHGLSEPAQLALRDAIIADRLSADDAQKIAKVLKASGPINDSGEALLRIQDARSRIEPRRSTDPDADNPIALLDAITAAATGGRTEQQRLLALTRDAMAAPFDAARFESQILGLARTLARMPADQRESDPTSRALLGALNRAMTALLESDPR